MATVSIKDVAKEAGVSTATVSHVINATRFVSEETRQKVVEAIETLDYHPNAAARSLVTKSTRKIGLVIADITNPFFTAVTRGVEDEISQRRYHTILCNTDEDPEREDDYLRLLMAQQIDGLIIAPIGVLSEPLLQMGKAGIPIVLLDRTSPGVEAPLVGVANEEGAYAATRYLIELGHRRIIFLMTLKSISTQQDRLSGFKRALHEANIPVDENWIINADPRFYGISPSLPTFPVKPSPKSQNVPSAYEVLRELLKSPSRPSAVFVANNQLMLGTLYAFKECGLLCPQDISLIGFDDQDWAPIFSPPLTVVSQPTYQLGQTAASLLMKLIQGETIDPPPPFPAGLIIRESCQVPQFI